MSSRTLRPLLALLAALALAACGGGADDPPAAADDPTTATGSEAPADDTTEDAAAEQPDDGGDEETAEVEFMGAAYVIAAEESFGCFLVEDGGSQGAVSFSGTADDGAEFEVDWAGDSLDSAFVSFTLADGAQWQTTLLEPDVTTTISGSSATIDATLVSLADGTEAALSAAVSC